MKRFAIVALLTLLLAGSAGAARNGKPRFVHVVKRYGAFTATLTYRNHPKDWLTPTSGVTLSVRRGGQLVLRRKICQPQHFLARCAWGQETDLSVTRVGPSNAPAFLLDMWTGGNTCCGESFVALLGQRVRLIHHEWSWMDAGAERLRGHTVFAAGDGRFYCAFSVCAGGVTPIQIWTIDSADRFIDATRRFPELIRRQARSLATGFGPGHSIRDQGSGVLAAWCADEYLLGKGARCSRVVAYAVRRHWPKTMQGAIPGPGFGRALNRDLERWGYKRVAAPTGRIVLGVNHYCAHSQDCGKGEIAVVNADGSGLHVLTHDAVTETDPVWSPDGSQIAFLKPKAHTSDQIWVMNANGTNQHALTNFGASPQIFGAENLPALTWSPNGQDIVFSAFPSNGGGREQLFRINVRTHHFVPLGHVAGGATNPVCSPDGRWIAFSSTVGNDAIYLLSPTTLHAHPLRTSKGGAVTGQGLAWSPDSRSLAFNNGGKVVAFDTTTKLFTTLARFGESPSWSPDGQWVVFGSGGYVKEVQSNGTGLRAILHADVSKRHYYEPDWGH